MAGFVIADDRTTVIERLTPDPDGARTDFYTTYAYKAASISVWKNGLLKVADWDDGYTLPAAMTVRMKEAPLTGDSLQVQYDL